MIFIFVIITVSRKKHDYISIYKAMEYKAMEYKAMEYKAMEYKAMEYKAIEYKAMEYKAMEYKIIKKKEWSITMHFFYTFSTINLLIVLNRKGRKHFKLFHFSKIPYTEIKIAAYTYMFTTGPVKMNKEQLRVIGMRK